MIGGSFIANRSGHHDQVPQRQLALQRTRTTTNHEEPTTNRDDLFEEPPARGAPLVTQSVCEPILPTAASSAKPIMTRPPNIRKTPVLVASADVTAPA